MWIGGGWLLSLVSISLCLSCLSYEKKIHRTDTTLWKPPVQQKRQIQLVERDRMNSIGPMNFFSYDRYNDMETRLYCTIPLPLICDTCIRSWLPW